MDRNALDPDELGTQDVLARMLADQKPDPYADEVAGLQNQLHAAQNLEGQTALARLLVGLVPMAGLAHRAMQANRHLPQAIDKHLRIEKGRNANITGITNLNEPFVRAYLYGATPPLVAAARRAGVTETPMFGKDARILSKTESPIPLKGHAADAADIMNYLDHLYPANKVLY